MDKQKYFLYRKFHLTLISAENLPNVRKFFKSKVYAKVSFGGDKKTEQRTRTDKHGGLNPAWNYTMNYKIGESGIAQYGLQLVIKLYCKSKLGDRYIGEIHKSIKELFDCAYRWGGSYSFSHPINNGGVLKCSYKFGERIKKKKPGFFKKVLLPGACLSLRVIVAVTYGVDIPVSFHSKKPNIVDPDKLNKKKGNPSPILRIL